MIQTFSFHPAIEIKTLTNENLFDTNVVAKEKTYFYS